MTLETYLPYYEKPELTFVTYQGKWRDLMPTFNLIIAVTIEADTVYQAEAKIREGLEWGGKDATKWEILGEQVTAQGEV
jgi:hypothetical protein